MIEIRPHWSRVDTVGEANRQGDDVTESHDGVVAGEVSQVDSCWSGSGGQLSEAGGCYRLLTRGDSAPFLEVQLLEGVSRCRWGHPSGDSPHVFQNYEQNPSSNDSPWVKTRRPNTSVLGLKQAPLAMRHIHIDLISKTFSGGPSPKQHIHPNKNSWSPHCSHSAYHEAPHVGSVQS